MSAVPLSSTALLLLLHCIADLQECNSGDTMQYNNCHPLPPTANRGRIPYDTVNMVKRMLQLAAVWFWQATEARPGLVGVSEVIGEKVGAGFSKGAAALPSRAVLWKGDETCRVAKLKQWVPPRARSSGTVSPCSCCCSACSCQGPRLMTFLQCV